MTTNNGFDSLHSHAQRLKGVDGVTTISARGAAGIDGTVSQAVDKKMEEINRNLPQGVHAVTVYDRTVLVDKAINTVKKNLIEGALLAGLDPSIVKTERYGG